MGVNNNFFRIEKKSRIDTKNFRIKDYCIFYVFGKRISIKIFNLMRLFENKKIASTSKIIRNKKEIDDFIYENMVSFQKAFQYNAVFDTRPDEITFQGICSYCGKEVVFLCEKFPQYSPDIMFSETLKCPQCLLGNRLRAIISVFQKFEKTPQNLKIYLQEYTTNFFLKFEEMLTSNGTNTIIGSEFLGYDKKAGEIIDGIRHENALNLSFHDNELEYIISNDVLEHVPDIDKALSEIVRCLKPGGKLICHIPFSPHLDKTRVRAEIKEGTIIYHEEKEYHGGFSCDDPHGCLAFYNFGIDFFDTLKEAGFKDSYCLGIVDEKYMNIGYEPVFIWIGEK